jgi:hypothetical protein
MSEEQAEYKTTEMRDVLGRARKVMLRNALVKVKEGKSLTAHEAKIIQEAEAEAEHGSAEGGLGRGTQENFKNLREVVAYLKGQSWKVSQATVYKHQNEGKIKSERDGTFTLKHVLRYARGFLMLREAKQKVDDEELQRRKTKAEIRRIDEQGKFARIKRMVEEGKYILRDQFELELAARAAVLEAGLKYAIQAKAGEWIDAVKGDHERTGDLIRIATDALNLALNEFATTKEFHVVFAVSKEKSRQDEQD